MGLVYVRICSEQASSVTTATKSLILMSRRAFLEGSCFVTTVILALCTYHLALDLAFANPRAGAWPGTSLALVTGNLNVLFVNEITDYRTRNIRERLA